MQERHTHTAHRGQTTSGGGGVAKGGKVVKVVFTFHSRRDLAATPTDSGLANSKKDTAGNCTCHFCCCWPLDQTRLCAVAVALPITPEMKLWRRDNVVLKQNDREIERKREGSKLAEINVSLPRQCILQSK